MNGDTAINLILRIAAHDNNLFRRETFEALTKALARHIPLDCLAVVVPEPAGKRLYAASPAEGGRELPPFGARFPHGPKEEAVLRQGKIKICDDTRSAETVDQIAVHWGFLSYAILPIRRRPWNAEEAMVNGQRAPASLVLPPERGTGSGSQSNPDAEGPIVGNLIVAFRERGCASKVPLDLLKLLADLFGETFQRAISLARERRLAMIIETSGDAMLAWDHDARITDANGAASRLTGHTRDQLIGRSIYELFEPGCTPSRASHSGRAFRTNLRRRGAVDRPELPPVTVSVTMTAVEDDPLVAMHALIRDVSHVVAAEREAALHFGRVRELEKELRAILDNAPLIIFRLDAKAKEIKYLNRHAERLLGIPTADALKTPDFLRMVHRSREARSAFDAAVEDAKAGKVSPPYEARLQWGSGDEIAVRGTVYPLVGERGNVVAIEGILADVSAEHAARSRAVQADRLSTLGMLAASVAHEINNPAAFILLGLTTLERMLGGRAYSAGDVSVQPVCAILEELRDSMDRIVRIARDLRLYASPAREGSLSVTEVDEVVESAVSLTRGRIFERAKLVKDISAVPPVLLDNGRLVQVIVNLLLNATQALTKDSVTDPVITIATRETAGRVQIEVSDTGVGIPQENLSRIWAPFFTTKSADLGSGLGLSISREIVERAGGTISVESPTFETQGGPRGSRFIISLPAAADASPAASGGAPLPAASSLAAPRVRVLVVEDEASLARALATEVGRVHDVVVAHCAERALELLAQARFDVVLCDLRMPGMSGEALYERVRERDPAQARDFVFMSGIGFVPEVERFLSATGRPVLHKPFPSGRVLELISELSAGPTARGTATESDRGLARAFRDASSTS
jgi:PAS domain S-box-containing protein